MKRYMSKSVLTFFCLLFFGFQLIQAQKISGKIVNIKTGEPVPLAVISTENEQLITVADQQGRFVLQIPENGSFPEIHAVGYESLRITDKVLSEAAKIELQPVVPGKSPGIKDVKPEAYVLECIEKYTSQAKEILGGYFYFRKETSEQRQVSKSQEGYMTVHKPDTETTQERLLLWEEKKKSEVSPYTGVVQTEMLSQLPPTVILKGAFFPNEDFLSAEKIKNFQFEFGEETGFRGLHILTVTFRSRVSKKVKGTLYFEKKSGLLTGWDYESPALIPAAKRLTLSGFQVSAPKQIQKIRYWKQNGKWIPLSMSCNLSTRLSKRNVFRPGKVIDLKADLFGMFLPGSNTSSVPEEKRFITGKEMKDQVYPLSGVTWEKVNRLPLE